MNGEEAKYQVQAVPLGRQGKEIEWRSAETLSTLRFINDSQTGS